MLKVYYSHVASIKVKLNLLYGHVFSFCLLHVSRGTIESSRALVMALEKMLKVFYVMGKA